MSEQSEQTRRRITDRAREVKERRRPLADQAGEGPVQLPDGGTASGLVAGAPTPGATVDVSAAPAPPAAGHALQSLPILPQGESAAGPETATGGAGPGLGAWLFGPLPGLGGPVTAETPGPIVDAAMQQKDGAVAAKGGEKAGEDHAPAAPDDPAIAALDLGPTARAAALQLKQKHPEIVFTSGRRTVAHQAHAMASNIVSSSNRKWIAKTYISAAKLQAWVDAHPEAASVDDIAAGLEETMNTMPDSERGRISKHLSGEAFDIKPQSKDAAAIKQDIQALPGLSKFLDHEGGLVRWHAQF